MAGATGLEPAASGVTGRRSNQLSYARVTRVNRGAPCTGRPEDCQACRPLKTAWLAAHPIDAAGMVGDDGFEPPTLSV